MGGRETHSPLFSLLRPPLLIHPHSPNPNPTTKIMCRSTTPNDFRDRVRIRSFFLRLAGAGGGTREQLPETLTLVYLPRIDGSLLEVNGSKVPAEAPAIVPLHRVRLPQEEAAEALYASTDRVRAGEGARFEVYVGEEKAVRGAFRRGEGRRWGLECRGAAEGKVRAAGAAEVLVAEEGAAGVMKGRVDFAAEGRRRRRRRREGFCLKLDEIPEESDGCDCLCCEGGEEETDASDGEDSERTDGGDEELEMEGVKWAVDVGLWVMCLGVGLLVSRASSKALRSKFF